MNDLEGSRLWKLALEIAEEAYACLDDFPEEEQWSLASKLRSRSSDVTTYVAEALGSIDPRDKKWGLGKVRSNLFAVKSIYKLAYKTNMLPVIPESMVKIDAAIKETDKLVDGATGDIPKWFREMDAPNKKGQK